MATLKVSELINLLQAVQKDMGDRPVYLSSDPEGNGYGSIQKDYSVGEDEAEKVLILYPCEQFADTEDLE